MPAIWRIWLGLNCIVTERNGYCHRTALLGSAVLMMAAIPGTGIARPTPAPVLLPAGTLADALRWIAARTGSEIISLEPGLSQISVTAKPLEGGAATMLDKVLRDTGFRAVRIAASSFRIERVRTARAASSHRGTARAAEARPADIIVTASKFPVPLRHYPGSVMQMKAADEDYPAARSGSMDRLATNLPVLQHTEFGEGRNKIFIRGIADSSFNGATQPTASIYFGDALLGFGSPSPNLKLYDIANVEVLEGPQGTLYGSGSMGGVVHISPNPVDFDTVSGSAALGASATIHGRPGWDASAMMNVPLATSRVGVRVVGYHEHEGGYLDNAAVGRDSNSVNVSGGRIAVAAHVGDMARLDAGVLYQVTDGDDAPYVGAGDSPLGRRTLIAEPYESKLLLGYFGFEKQWWGSTKLTSITSLGTRSSFDVFDSTPGSNGPAVAYQIDRASSMFAHETRLSRRNDRGISWVGGVTYQQVRDGLTRSLGLPDQPNELDEVTNTTHAASLFGQASIALGKAFEATLGLRWTTARTDSEPSRDRAPLIRGVSAQRTDPTVALAWHVAPRTMLYSRVQTGYRNGGMAVARGIGRVANFDSDSVIMGEIGVRRMRSGPQGLSLSAAISYTDWDDIQADLITRRGLPYTANLGNARVLAAETVVDWVPLAGLTLAGSLLYMDSHLSGALAEQSAPRDRRLPVTPPLAATGRAGYTWGDTDGLRHRIGGMVRYVGRSILGPGMLISTSQGSYTVADIYGGVRHGRVDVSLSIENLFNARASRFSFGNPITFAVREQSVPLRPMTVRLAMGVNW